MEKKYYVGIDLGGTFVKGGVVREDGVILSQDKVPTQREQGGEKVVENIAYLTKKVVADAGLELSQMQGIGMGVPGMIDSKNGVVTYSNNFGWEQFPIAKLLQEQTGLSVYIANDANVAALGEVKFGAAKEFESAIMLTLGTGVGGGIVVDGKLLEGNRSAGAELGHSVIEIDGEQCSCGVKGCLEAYASATALIRDTKRVMEENKDSQMWEIGSLENVTGKTAFDYKNTDKYAKAVVDKYIKYLGQGIVNFANIFRPEAVILGGGVCAQGDELIVPLQAIVDKNIYAGAIGPRVPVIVAKLGNTAGLLGAAALLM